MAYKVEVYLSEDDSRLLLGTAKTLADVFNTYANWLEAHDRREGVCDALHGYDNAPPHELERVNQDSRRLVWASWLGGWRWAERFT